jgi:hypothetical protein
MNTMVMPLMFFFEELQILFNAIVARRGCRFVRFNSAYESIEVAGHVFTVISDLHPLSNVWTHDTNFLLLIMTLR